MVLNPLSVLGRLRPTALSCLLLCAGSGLANSRPLREPVTPPLLAMLDPLLLGSDLTAGHQTHHQVVFSGKRL